MSDLSAVLFELKTISAAGRAVKGGMAAENFLELADLAELVRPAEVDVYLNRDEGRLHVTGHGRGTVRLSCSRCLESFESTLELDIDRFYVDYEPPVSEGAEIEMEDDVVYLPDGLFSLLRMMEEELILALPMITLCRSECRGLCAGCGADLNKEKCQCVNEESESPFAVLRTLKT